MSRLRGLRDIPSITRSRRSKSLTNQTQYNEYEVFNELTRLGREKALLNKERENWQEKLERIDARLKEMEKLEESLRRQIATKEKMTSDVQDARREGREVVIKY